MPEPHNSPPPWHWNYEGPVCAIWDHEWDMCEHTSCWAAYHNWWLWNEFLTGRKE